ncbi:Peptidoglycan/xylan/chitin deacetylase, PgdA/CDA1 family [Acidaminococcus fermentans]|uniref:Peptidoglycan/xylan/chitin deacetylase, PgdA/CDA1 family n=1 Tax=Acidaminococcus fermentans TaxID=905 RepID=A0A1H2T5X8_ACIFE|nr:polysaccharide deacetylase family protein [Acidaminococcus fermentans]SDW39248.1 Peptidoglycan/xylan/chitin deacetylase, PgdA/CDA1 family [Acidaminococcus fermentans]SFO75580.1 Peptidoglycan/xylan/chitin deacetylase, PgdA/CDA1 family [Acidaminococcus fermentans]
MLYVSKGKTLVLASLFLAQAAGWGLAPAEGSPPGAFAGRGDTSVISGEPVPDKPVEQPQAVEVPAGLENAVLPGTIQPRNPEESLPLPKRKLPKGMKGDQVVRLLQANRGQLAVEESTLSTTAPAIPFTFTGLTRRASVDAMLKALEETRSRGTFFVTDREIRTAPETVRAILDAGQEVGICFYPLKGETVTDMASDILRTRTALRQQFGVDSQLVKQASGAVQPEIREAVSALGCRLIGARVNLVQSRHRNCRTPEEILPDIYGPGVKAAARGGIIQIRLDWYSRPELAAELFLYLKRKKIDNIAYNGFGDASGVNPANDSAYKIVSVGNVLADRDHLWQYPVPDSAILPQVKMTPLLAPGASHQTLVTELARRYVGEPSTRDRQSLGFTARDFLELDTTGCVKTQDPVIFFGFDDWGDEDSVNHILYVLRKHHVPGNFFILTHNMVYQPNLLRAIAMEGHDIGSHTDLHKPMTAWDRHHDKRAMESYEEFYEDVKTSYLRLARTVGDLRRPNGRPVLTKFFRPPTLTISAVGTRALLENGFQFIVSGHAIDDYAAPDLATELKRFRDAIYCRGQVRKGAVFVIHMTSAAKYTPAALDVLLTENEKKPEGDPTRFQVGLLSDYLTESHSQARTPGEARKERRRIRWW